MTQQFDTPIIPRKILFDNPDRALVRLSPDGQHLSYLAPVEGVLNVWVGPADDPTAAQPVTDDRERGIRFYGWAYTNHHLFYLQDSNGDENWHIYVVNLTTGEITDLTPLPGVQARFQDVSEKFPHEILIALNDRNEQLHDIYRLNIQTGERQLIQQNDGFTNFITDDDYHIRFAMRMTPAGGTELLAPTDTGDWELFAEIGLEDNLTTFPVGFDKTGQTLYLLDSRGRNTAAMFALNLETGDQTLLADNERADVIGTLTHPTEKHIQAVSFIYTRKEWHILDESITPDFDYLRGVAEGDFEIISRTLADDEWIVSYEMDNGPVRYYHYHRADRQATFLFTSRPNLADQPLVNMQATVIPSSDGLDLVSYYSLPATSNGQVKLRQPLPMVLLVHGGPWGRDTWGYNAEHQWLVNRGYAVLSVNFRGSTGLGKAFINAANGEWGGKMHHDLLDAVQWAIDQGLADPERIAIMGGSYGGYATLVGLTFTPTVFACGVDIVGPSNLITLLESIPPYWTPMIELFTKRVGDHRLPEGRAFLKERSPLTYVERIQRPLLIAQGANDPRVKQAEATQIVSAMEEQAIPVTYVLYDDEGHGFARPENRLSFYAITEAFLAEHLGGRYEAIGDDFTNSSLDVPIGADEIPDLMEALPE